MPLHPFDRLLLDDAGSVLFTPCPGTRDADLRDSLQQLADAGATALITLMPAHEMQQNGVAELPALCSELGLQWFHFPIEDDAAPAQEFAEAWQRDLPQVMQILDAQGTAAIHCKGGSGRTGLMVAALLRERGTSLERVMEKVQALRPKALKLDAHIDYLKNLKEAG